MHVINSFIRQMNRHQRLSVVKGEEEEKIKRRLHSKLLPSYPGRWRWVFMPGTVIQIFVVLTNKIRCWLDNDTVRLVCCTHQVAVFTINITPLRPPAHTHAHNSSSSYKGGGVYKVLLFAILGSVSCHCWGPAGGKYHLFFCYSCALSVCNKASKDF